MIVVWASTERFVLGLCTVLLTTLGLASLPPSLPVNRGIPTPETQEFAYNDYSQSKQNSFTVQLNKQVL